MGFLAKLGSLFSRGGGYSYILNAGPSRNSVNLLKAYKTHPWLRAVTSRIATGVASTPWTAYARSSEPSPERLWRHGVDKAVVDYRFHSTNKVSRSSVLRQLRGTGELKELPDHPLLALLTSPNPWMSGHALWTLVQIYLDLRGEAFLIVERGSSGMPASLVPVPPHWVTVTSDGFRVNFASFGLTFDVPKTDMIWLRHLDPADPIAGRGAGQAEALADELEIDENASKTINEWFANKAIPAVLISVQGGAGEAALKAAQEKWNRDNQGVGKGGRAHFLQGGATVTRLDSSWKDQQFVELRKNERDFIRQVFSIPPEILGDMDSSNRATAQAAFALFAEGVLVPRLEFIRVELQRQLVAMFDERICLDYWSPVPEDREFSLKIMQGTPEAFELNEFRTLAEKEPKPELEGVYARHVSGAQSNAAETAEPPATAKPEPVEEGDEDDQKGDPPWVNSFRLVK